MKVGFVFNFLSLDSSDSVGCIKEYVCVIFVCLPTYIAREFLFANQESHILAKSS